MHVQLQVIGLQEPPVHAGEMAPKELHGLPIELHHLQIELRPLKQISGKNAHAWAYLQHVARPFQRSNYTLRRAEVYQKMLAEGFFSAYFHQASSEGLPALSLIIINAIAPAASSKVSIEQISESVCPCR